MTVKELIAELNKIDNKNKEVYIHDIDDGLTTFIKVRDYTDGVVLWVIPR